MCALRAVSKFRSGVKGVWGSEFRVWDFGAWVSGLFIAWGLESSFWGFGFWVECLMLRVLGLVFKVQGLGFRV
jgi:hypothetical protein